MTLGRYTPESINAVPKREPAMLEGTISDISFSLSLCIGVSFLLFPFEFRLMLCMEFEKMSPASIVWRSTS